MEITDSRILVAGATGVLGGYFSRALSEGGARLALAGRDHEALRRIASELECPAIPLDYADPSSAPAATSAAVHELGGLDGLVIATGTVAFGEVGQLSTEVEEALVRTNLTGPISLVSAALDSLVPGGTVVGITAVVAEFPTAGMAAYSASKAGLASYLTALRRERRKDLSVLEVSPGHMETGFAGRALAGSPPGLPEGADPELLTSVVMEAIAAGRREVRYDMRDRELKVK